MGLHDAFGGFMRDSGWWEWERAAKTEWTHARAPRTLRSPVQLIDKVTYMTSLVYELLVLR